MDEVRLALHPLPGEMQRNADQRKCDQESSEWLPDCHDRRRAALGIP